MNFNNFCDICCSTYIGSAVPPPKKMDCMRSCQLSIDPNDGLDDGGSGLFLISFIIS
jgi:hypothetical protein